MKGFASLLLLFIVCLTATSCVSKKRYDELFAARGEINASYASVQEELKSCQDEKTELLSQLENRGDELNGRDNELTLAQSQIKSLENQLDVLKSTNANLLDRLSDLSVVSKTGAESIKKSLETLNQQSAYIQDLNTVIQQKDSVNFVLVQNLKRSLDDINDEDISVEVIKGVVYVSISDKLLFNSGSSRINGRAKEILGKVAKVVNDHNEIEILVEGHTDDVPITTDCVRDNWDLSVRRATAVVRVLQEDHGVSPERMIAGGRAEYVPKTSNETDEGRQENRRTEIVITPKLDEFFELLTPQGE